MAFTIFVPAYCRVTPYTRMQLQQSCGFCKVFSVATSDSPMYHASIIIYRVQLRILKTHLRTICTISPSIKGRYLATYLQWPSAFHDCDAIEALKQAERLGQRTNDETYVDISSNKVAGT